MGVRKVDAKNWYDGEGLSQKSQAYQLTLKPESVLITRNGIEFYSRKPFPLWAEMTIVLESEVTQKRIQCNGVVVSCKGNRQAGYHVALLFMGISPETQSVLTKLARSSWTWI